MNKKLIIIIIVLIVIVGSIGAYILISVDNNGIKDNNSIVDSGNNVKKQNKQLTEDDIPFDKPWGYTKLNSEFVNGIFKQSYRNDNGAIVVSICSVETMTVEEFIEHVKRENDTFTYNAETGAYYSIGKISGYVPNSVSISTTSFSYVYEYNNMWVYVFTNDPDVVDSLLVF